ncbi:MAG: LTA synthase family protein [Sedimentisphaerales bacterium]|nr:LTA synthase family protein [Sedimentisphaerales bacterium]
MADCDIGSNTDISHFRSSMFARIARQRPRTESLVLWIGLCVTVYAKIVLVSDQNVETHFLEVFGVIASDICFFFVLMAIFHALYWMIPGKAAARLTLVISLGILGWSLANAGWLLRSQVQLQPGILAILIRDITELWPLVRSHLFSHFIEMLILLSIGFLGVLWLLWRFIRPICFVHSGRYHRNCFLGTSLIALSCWGLQGIVVRNSQLGFTGEILGFSSHWQAAVSIVSGSEMQDKNNHRGRAVPLAGERRIEIPDLSSEQKPNIILVLLESVPYCVTSLSGNDPNRTPYLTELAGRGISFECARVPVSHTTKAYWAVLTGSIPSISSDYVEAVPMGQPYESLATILGRIGYRSAFFEMSKGTYECAPGLFYNLGFDLAWFRENLEDPSAHLGYLAGDDFRIIPFAVQWAAEETSPFLLMTITTVTHDPYEVPSWYAAPAINIEHQYTQALQYTDLFLKTLCLKLTERGLMDNTLVCVIGDHGTGLNLSRDQARWRPREEVIQVPWVLSWPGHLPTSRVIRSPVSQLDVTPTILRLLGLGLEEADFGGLDALQPIEMNRKLYFSSWYGNSPMGFVQGEQKYVYWPYLKSVLQYNLRSDPLENHPIEVQGKEKRAIIDDILSWQQKTQIFIDAKRYYEKRIFDHWQVFGTGRSAWAYYVP